MNIQRLAAGILGADRFLVRTRHANPVTGFTARMSAIALYMMQQPGVSIASPSYYSRISGKSSMLTRCFLLLHLWQAKVTRDLRLADVDGPEMTFLGLESDLLGGPWW